MRGRHPLGAASAWSAVAIAAALLGSVVNVAPASAIRAAADSVNLQKVAWTRSPSDPPGAGNLASLATDGERFVVSGLALQPVPGFVPIWTSTNGVKWVRAAGKTSAFPPGTLVSVVTYAHGRFLAFGQLLGSSGVLAWSSSDGARWKSYKPKGFPPDPGTIPVSVATTKKGLALQTLEDGETYHLWTSSGDTWKSAGVVPGDPKAFVAGVVSGHGHTKFVAAGRSGAVAAWTSKSGATWTPASITGPNPAAYESINAVVPGGPGFVAVGVVNSSSGSEVAYAWTSTDGKTWVSKDSPAFAGAADTSTGMDAASVRGTSLLAAGHDGSKVALWASANGTTWKRAADEPEFEVKNGTNAQAAAIASTKGRVVVVFRERSFSTTQGRFVLNGLGIVSGKLGKG